MANPSLKRIVVARLARPFRGTEGGMGIHDHRDMMGV